MPLFITSVTRAPRYRPPTNLFPTNCCPPLSVECLGSRLRTCSWSGNFLDPFSSLSFSLPPYLSLDPKYCAPFSFLFLSLPLSLSVPPFIFFWLCISLFLFVSWSRIKKKVIDMQMDGGNSIFCLLWGEGDFYEVRIAVGL